MSGWELLANQAEPGLLRSLQLHQERAALDKNANCAQGDVTDVQRRLTEVHDEVAEVERRREHAVRDEVEAKREKDAALRRCTRAELDLKEAESRLTTY